EVAAMYGRAAERHGGIDVLFNNAGIAPPDDVSVLDTSLEAWRRGQEVNLTAGFLCWQHGRPHLLGPGGGAGGNGPALGAVGGGPPPQLSHPAAGGGVPPLPRARGVEVPRRNVRVNA